MVPLSNCEWSCSAQIGMLYFFSNNVTAEEKKEIAAGLNVKNNKAGIHLRVKFACGHVRTLSNMASLLDFGGRNVFGLHGVQTKQLCLIHFFLSKMSNTEFGGCTKWISCFYFYNLDRAMRGKLFSLL